VGHTQSIVQTFNFGDAPDQQQSSGLFLFFTSSLFFDRRVTYIRIKSFSGDSFPHRSILTLSSRQKKTKFSQNKSQETVTKNFVSTHSAAGYFFFSIQLAYPGKKKDSRVPLYKHPPPSNSLLPDI
jgi:hypothetical protein